MERQESCAILFCLNTEKNKWPYKVVWLLYDSSHQLLDILEQKILIGFISWNFTALMVGETEEKEKTSKSKTEFTSYRFFTSHCCFFIYDNYCCFSTVLGNTTNWIV